MIDRIVDIVEKYGCPDKINSEARRNGSIELLVEKAREKNSEYAGNLAWLGEQIEKKKFISIDEYLYYYTSYGVKQVLNINGATVLAGYLLHKLGVEY